MMLDLLGEQDLGRGKVRMRRFGISFQKRLLPFVPLPITPSEPIIQAGP